MDYSRLLRLFRGDEHRELLEMIEFLKAESRLLKGQFDTLGKRIRLTDEERRELAILGKRLDKGVLAELISIVKPETLLKWYRHLVTRKYDSSKAPRKVGRPEIPPHVAKLVIRLARENRSWGYERIEGELKHLGHVVSHESIRKILKRHGLEPAPEREGKTTWREFIERHRDLIWGTD